MYLRLSLNWSLRLRRLKRSEPQTAEFTGLSAWTIRYWIKEGRQASKRQDWQKGLDRLEPRLSNTRMRPQHSGFVQSARLEAKSWMLARLSLPIW
jgi:hypothetical protein